VFGQGKSRRNSKTIELAMSITTLSNCATVAVVLLVAVSSGGCGSRSSSSKQSEEAKTMVKHPPTAERKPASLVTANDTSHSGTSHDEFDSEFSELSNDADDIQIKVNSLRDDVDELIVHHGDVHSADSDSSEIVTQTQDLLERVEHLKSKAAEANHYGVESKCDALEGSVNTLLLSASQLHDAIETAQLDSHYRHHEGISEMSDGMDDVENDAQEVTSDAD
jgi:hypothetical protein